MMWKAVLPVLAVVLGVGFCVLVGGLREMATNDPGAMNALKFAVSRHNRLSNDMYRNEVNTVVRVQSQVVSGMKYVITANMARTTCKKNATTEHCPVYGKEHELAKNYTCTFTVWSRPWMNSIQLLNEQCA